MSSSESEADENPYDQGDERVKFSKLFVLKKVLGKGAFGIVVSAVLKANLKEYAVKVFIIFCHKNPSTIPFRLFKRLV